MTVARVPGEDGAGGRSQPTAATKAGTRTKAAVFMNAILRQVTRLSRFNNARQQRRTEAWMCEHRRDQAGEAAERPARLLRVHGDCASRANARVASLGGHTSKGTTNPVVQPADEHGVADARAKAVEILDKFATSDLEAAKRGK